jgi:glutamyl-tRNA reductase
MSLLVVGLSHKTAPVSILERAAVTGDTLGKLLHDVARLPDIAETFVISTCNRVEVYAEVDRFHGGVAGVCDLLSRYSGIPASELTSSLYVHYEDRAIQHLLAVSCGLESMVVGEDQILGQVRTALKAAGDHGTLGRSLRDLGRLALRTGKRARAETGIDRLGLSLVSVGIDLAIERLKEPAGSSSSSPRVSSEPVGGREAPPQGGTGGLVPPFGGSPGARGDGGREPPMRGVCPPGGILFGLRVLVIGAGGMSGLAVSTAARAGAERVAVANRTRAKAERLAAGVGGVVADFTDLSAAIAHADLVISCTGAAKPVVTEKIVQDVLRRRDEARRLVLLDLAMPRDVDPAVADLVGPAGGGVSVINMDTLRASGGCGAGDDEVAAVRAIVEDEFAAYGSAVRAARVTPTVVALRAKAATVVDAELARLAGRLSEESLSGHALEEMAQTVRRVVDKLLHAPTVRVKELASSPDGEEYAAALRVLFDLDPRTVDAVTHAEVESPNTTNLEGNL